MPKKGKTGATRHDKWYHLAKEQGFRSRAAFKLVQLNKKYDFLASSHALLDLCAAPGGWLQVAQKYMPAESLIIGVDLLAIKAIPGVITLQEDILTPKCRQQIRKESRGRMFDTVIHDGAPNVGGATWAKDAYGQTELVLHSLRLATEMLRPGGHFITKVFRSQDYNSLLWVMQQFFKKVDVTKPTASRNTSAEIYVVGLGYLAPKSIDPRLLDPAHVFKTTEPVKTSAADIFGKAGANKRNRQGYADGVTMLYTEAPVMKFIEAENPIELLGAHNRLVFDADSQAVQSHESTTAEIRALVDDLKVIGKADFRRLLQWRATVRAFLKSLADAQRLAEEGPPPELPPLTEAEKADLEEERLGRELDELQQKIFKKQRQLRRRRHQEKIKARRRVAMSLNMEDVEREAEQGGTFSLRRLPDADALAKLEQEANMDVSDGDLSDSSDDMLRAEDGGDDDDDGEGDSAAEPVDYKERLARDLDSLYTQYKERRHLKSRLERRRGKAVGLGDDELDEDDAVAASGEQVHIDPLGSEDEASDESDEERLGRRNPLVVRDAPLGTSPAARASRWFDGDLFAGVLGGDDGAPSSAASAADLGAVAASGSGSGSMPQSRKRKAPSSGAEPLDHAAGTTAASKRRTGVSTAGGGDAGADDGEDDDENDDGDDDDDEDDENDDGFDLDRVAALDKDYDGADSDDDPDPISRRRKRLAAASGFEEVPEEEDEERSDWSDDSDAKAEVMAIGKHFLHKKSRESLADAAYNRYAWGDDEQLPEWFVMDEEERNKPELPVTKEEVMAFKQQLKAINARPISKIAEARARKKMRTARRLENLNKKAEAIVNSEGGSGSEKMRQIEKLYRRDSAKDKKVAPTYVVARKSGGKRQTEARAGIKGPIKVVDPRMKKDKRAKRVAERRAKGGGGKRRKVHR